MKKATFFTVTVTVLAITAALGEYVYEGQWGTRGAGNGQFDRPREVSLAPNGNVYVVDTYNSRIQYFSPTGVYLGKWGSRGTGNGYFNSPEGIAVAPNGNVYVADTQRHRIQYFTANGSFLGKWGTEGTGDYLLLPRRI
jgi:tripartite motif-containing protein 71